MVSFLIPAYNSSETIERAIKSILNQEKCEIKYEIIVVDDGGIDDLEEKIKKYQNVKYFRKENTGVADTRNYAVEKSNGDYIIFVDSDDFISNSLLKNIEKYIKQNIDLIKWSPIFVDENLKEIYKPKTINIQETTGEKAFNILFGKDPLIDCLWNYAIKKKQILRFPNGRYHEDFAIMPKILVKVSTFVSINKYEYYYVQSKNSIMREENFEKTKKKIDDKLYHFDNLIKYINESNYENKTKENFLIYITNSLLAVIKGLDKKNKKYLKRELKKRRVTKYIKVKNLKQLLKKILLELLIL